MKWYIFSLLLLIDPARLAAAETETTDTLDRYHRKVIKYHNRWNALIPTQFIMQNAGNMGALSAGLGWDYGRHNQWETHLLLGVIPKHQSSRTKLTTTLKETFIPWNLDTKRGWALEPLTCGLYFNTVFGHEFWGHQPNRYPDSYYDFLSTKVRANVFLGQRVTTVIPSEKRRSAKSISAFYEISTCDLYLRAMVVDHYIKPKDIFGLSLGIKLLFM